MAAAGLGVILSGPLHDRRAARKRIYDMIQEATPWDHFVLSLAAYPHRTIEQTQFVLDCCREIQPGNKLSRRCDSQWKQ